MIDSKIRETHFGFLLKIKHELEKTNLNKEKNSSAPESSRILLRKTRRNRNETKGKKHGELACRIRR